MANTLCEIVEKIQLATKRPYLVGIDGLSAAGKSTLAANLQEQLNDLIVVHKDDFYRVMDETIRAKLNAEEGYHQYNDWQRLRDQVLIPISTGHNSFYQRYDWPTGKLAETIEVLPTGIIVVEGVSSIRPELRDYYDLTIWVETSNTQRYYRQIERNENPIEWIERWTASELYYFETIQPYRLANLTIAGE